MGVEDPELNSPDSSTEDHATDAVEPQLDSSEPGPESSPEPEGDTKFDPLSVVRDAVAKGRAKAASPAGEPSDQSKKVASEPKDAADGDDPDPPPFAHHPRWKQVLRERNELRGDATQFRQIQDFLTTNDVKPEEAAQALELAALVKRDPMKAWEILKPTVQDLLTRTGQVLPADLKTEVQAGRMTREVALEISRLRAAQTNTVSAQKMQQEADERVQRTQTARALSEAAAVWERSKTNDPDFVRLNEEIQKEVIWQQRQGNVPKSPAEVQKMLDDAFAKVRKAFARPAPRPSTQRTAPTTTRVATAQPAAQARSPAEMALDIVKRRGVTG